jgi:uncharacterized protein (TIGR03435 family)
MNAIRNLAMQPWVGRLGMTLLHFLWQGAIIAAIYAAARKRGARTLDANGRYLLACAALAAIAIVPLATWIWLRGPSPESVAATFAAPMSAARTGPARSIALSLPADVDRTAPGPFLSWVVAFWLIGATAFSLRLLAGWIFAERLRSSMVRPAPGGWQRTLNRLKTRISISRPVRLLVSAQVQAPAAIGWLRPIVLMPVGALAGLPAAQVEALLLHELAHIRRHDYLIHIWQSAVEAVFFYHPIVWWISSHMRAERELCCDDLAVSLTGDAVLYARALAEVDSGRWVQPTVMAADGGSLADRIARLLGQPATSCRPSCGPGAAAALILLAAGACAVFAQAGGRPQFEVASVKPSFSGGIQNVRPLPGRLTADASLRLLIQYAYGVQPFQVVDAAGWLQSGRYEIDAKADGNATRNQMFLMLQSLLEARFRLKIHRETKEMPVYALVAAKGGLKLPPPKPSGCVDSPADAAPEWAGGRMAAPGEAPSAPTLCGSAGITLGGMQGGKIAMPEFARKLSLMLDRSVIDKTGFTGLFDLQLHFVPDETTPAMPPPPPGSEASGPSLPQALHQQLGLQLESTKGPVEVIVVDHAERPAGN